MRLALSWIVITTAVWAQAPNLPPDYSARVAELEIARKASPGDLRVLDALAGSYSMGGQYGTAIEILREMFDRTASDVARQAEVRLKIARNLSWSGDSRGAIREYRQYLKSQPHDRQATVDLIRVLRYRGDYSQAEILCDRLLAQRQDDPEALALKAEVLHWAGNRRSTARAAAERAAELAPDFPDARVAHIYALRDQGENRAAMREFEALAAHVSRSGGPARKSTFGDAYRLLERDFSHIPHMLNNPAYAVYNDSDGIRNVFAGLQIGIPYRDDHKLRVDFGQYRSSAPLSSVFSAGRETSLLSEFAAGGDFRLARAVHLNLMGGGSRRSSVSDVRPAFDVRLAASPVDRWTFQFTTGREFLKVTPRAIDRDISSYKVGGGIQYAFDSRTSLALGADQRFWSDGNRSLSGETTIRSILRYHRPFMIDAGVLSRWERFERDTRFAAGFFTPERYARHDGFLGVHGELAHRIVYELRGSGGAQQLAPRADYRPSWEFASSASVRLTPSLELYASYQRRNYSLLSRNGWYHGFYITLGIRP